MKFAGKKFSKNLFVLPIIRGDDISNIVLQAVNDPDEFFKICPEPQPTGSERVPGGRSTPNTSAPAYLAARDKWNKQHWAWLLLEGLKATPELEWDEVDPADPETWEKIEGELRSSGLTKGEFLELTTAVYTVNGLDEDKVKDARESFFHTLSQAALAQ